MSLISYLFLYAKLTNTDKELKKALVLLFGKDIYTSYGILDRKKLSKIIFSNKEKLAKVNALIHPAVQKDYEQWLKDNPDGTSEEYAAYKLRLLVEP